jgi:hypothetical protein
MWSSVWRHSGHVFISIFPIRTDNTGDALYIQLFTNVFVPLVGAIVLVAAFLLLLIAEITLRLTVISIHFLRVLRS